MSRDRLLRLRTQLFLSCALAAVLARPLPADDSAVADAVTIAERHAASIYLIQDRAVQQEIQLTKQQFADLQKLSAAFTAEGRKPTSSQPRASTELTPRQPDPTGDRIPTYSKRLRAEILDAEQRDRLRQIQFQLLGMWFFLHKECRDVLQLDDSQLRVVEEVHAELLKRGDRYMREYKTQLATAQDDAEQRAKLAKALSTNLEEMEADGVARILAALTDEHRRKYAELTGKPFHRTRSQLKMEIRGSALPISGEHQ
jgi:hypothetical protein